MKNAGCVCRICRNYRNALFLTIKNALLLYPEENQIIILQTENFLHDEHDGRSKTCHAHLLKNIQCSLYAVFRSLMMQDMVIVHELSESDAFTKKVAIDM